MNENEKYDFIDRRMLARCAEWLCDETMWRNPFVSPLHEKDLKGLPPIYIQAGRKEVMHDQICAFVNKAREQKLRVVSNGCGETADVAATADEAQADLILDVYEDMNHVFQAHGDMMPQSKKALERMRQVIDKYVT